MIISSIVRFKLNFRRLQNKNFLILRDHLFERLYKKNINNIYEEDIKFTKNAVKFFIKKRRQGKSKAGLVCLLISY